MLQISEFVIISLVLFCSICITSSWPVEKPVESEKSVESLKHSLHRRMIIFRPLFTYQEEEVEHELRLKKDQEAHRLKEAYKKEVSQNAAQQQSKQENTTTRSTTKQPQNVDDDDGDDDNDDDDVDDENGGDDDKN
ncbi:uncharacterized protein LOC131436004 [Malaya genurostris]|uniref:uncharacterized protein LOC131436004 n=1 Tax=Malaya genurostris TaxID=325434 RepID=UPI0026F3A389|nr:uncharacterized protein LOC131436004 [Malaya genurostris]